MGYCQGGHTRLFTTLPSRTALESPIDILMKDTRQGCPWSTAARTYPLYFPGLWMYQYQFAANVFTRRDWGYARPKGSGMVSVELIAAPSLTSARGYLSKTILQIAKMGSKSCRTCESTENAAARSVQTAALRISTEYKKVRYVSQGLSF